MNIKNTLTPHSIPHWLLLLTAGALFAIQSLSVHANVSSVSITASPANTQVIGAPVDVTASSVASGPAEYQFGVKRQGDPQTQLLRDWGGPQWQWATSGLSDGNYILEVRARSVGNPVTYEAINWAGYQLVASTPVNQVSLSADPPLQQVEGGSVVFTADAVTTGSPEFQYLVKGPTDSAYQLVRDWGPALWESSTTGALTGNYIIQARARNVGSTVSYEAVTWLGYTLLSNAPSGLDIRPANTTCLATAQAPVNDRVATVSAFPNVLYPADLSVLTSLVQSPHDPNRWYALEKAGRVFSFSSAGGGSPAMTVLDLRAVIDSQGEGGMLGIAIHPDPADGRVFLFFTRPGNPQISYISSFLSTDGGNTLNPVTERIIGLLDQPSTVHKAGHLGFGPDGYLYISIGDGGGNNGPTRAQNTNNLYGTMLRLDVDNGTPYAIPPDNPFIGSGRPEIYALGFRNPWRWSFDPLNGDLWLGDVGEASWEEINKVVAGGNYGWGIREGAHCFPPGTMNCQTAGFIDPIVEYSHNDGVAVIGGYVYRGNAIPELNGIYLYADLFGKVWGIFTDVNGNPDPQLLIDIGLQGTVFSMAQDNEGEVYLVTPGDALKLVPLSGGPGPGFFPQKLSETGCVLQADPTQAAAGLIPYEINIPLWSDGASKDRWLALPDGETISYTLDGDLHFPVGSVLMKNFTLGGTLIESRLFMHHLDGTWGGYSYEWNASGTDADLLSEGKTINFNGQDYTYPSRTQCLRCHTAAAGFTLGPNIFQMNRDATYPSTGRTANQLVTLQHLDIFGPPLPAPHPQNLPALPEILDNSASLDVRARGYLHSNCGNCHMPGGGGRGPADFRYSLTGSLASMNICDVTPEVSNLGIANARLLAPGDPSRSIIAVRMQRLDSSTMPPVGHHVVDSDGLALISAWINSITACP